MMKARGIWRKGKAQRRGTCRRGKGVEQLLQKLELATKVGVILGDSGLRGPEAGLGRARCRGLLQHHDAVHAGPGPGEVRALPRLTELLESAPAEASKVAPAPAAAEAPVEEPSTPVEPALAVEETPGMDEAMK